MRGYQVMGDFLQRHAYDHVWCTPTQDKQAIFRPQRISPLNGHWIKFRHLWRSIKLPEAKGRYHIYHIGQIHPSILGLFTAKSGTWVSAPYMMEIEKLYLDIYNDRGIQVPRCLVHFIVSQDNNLLMAIKISQQEPDRLGIDLENQPINIRMYSNAFFETMRGNESTHVIRCISDRPATIPAITALQARIGDIALNPEQMHYYVNGLRVDRIDLISVQAGDYVDAIYDGSVKRTVTFNVRDLQEFNSDVDGIRKFLIHYAGNVDTIEYRDDVDMYLISPQGGGRSKGVYLHKNDDRLLRMVTHRDYSVSVQRIEGIAAANEWINDSASLQLKFYIRHSGYKRPLVFENNRIAELYKLSDDKIVRAMLGIDSTVSVWSAAALEASPYVRMMGAEAGAISRTAVQEAYGYNAISQLLGYTPTKPRVVGGIKLVDLPEGLRGCCTIYEYDRDGKLLGYSFSTLDDTHPCKYPETDLVEVIFGIGGTSLDIYLAGEADVDPNFNYRFYRCPAIGGISTGPWRDVTGTPVYLGTPGHYKWVADARSLSRVISNKRHLAYDIEVGITAGVYMFNIVHDSNNPGTYSNLDIPLGELDVFINGHSAIEGLDYYVRGHQVTITSKRYLIDNLTKQRITVRYTGFCKSDMTRDIPTERGFVYHGVLSHNNRFDLRDDKVVRITCGGALYAREELEFAEGGVDVRILDASNGAPYQIRDVVVPMNNYIIKESGLDDSTYTLLERAKVIDQEVGDYLTRMLPEQKREEPNSILGRYQLYSPFFSRILDDLITGVLWDERFYEHFGDEYIRQIAAPYLPLLDVDPVGGSNGYDERYCVVHVHPYHHYLDLDMYRWRIMQRIVQVYGNGRIDLSSMVRVQQF